MNSEQLQRWALVAEISGGLAVLVTLIVLVFQIAENTRAVRAQTASDLWNQNLQVQTSVSDSMRMEEVWLEMGTNGFQGMNNLDRMAAFSLMTRTMQVYDNAYYQYRQGTLNEEIFSRYRNPIEGGVRWRYFEEYWQERQTAFTDPFRAYIDELMEVNRAN